MNLHKNKELFSQAIEMASQHLHIKRKKQGRERFAFSKRFLCYMETIEINVYSRIARIVVYGNSYD